MQGRLHPKRTTETTGKARRATENPYKGVRDTGTRGAKKPIGSSAMGELVHGELTGRILAGAIEVHRHLGPGLVESAYRACLAKELRETGLDIQLEKPIALTYKGLIVEAAYRADLVVEDKVLVELKVVEHVLPVHEAQILTYLKLSGLRVGLLINFNHSRLQNGIHRFVR